jgi:hypothetical protein
MRPEDFAGGEMFTPERPMTGDCWSLPEIGWDEINVHPFHLLDEDDLLLLEMWRAWQGGMAGPGPLPEPGGLMDQPACVIASFHIMSAAEVALKPSRPKDHG